MFLPELEERSIILTKQLIPKIQIHPTESRLNALFIEIWTGKLDDIFSGNAIRHIQKSCHPCITIINKCKNMQKLCPVRFLKCIKGKATEFAIENCYQ